MVVSNDYINKLCDLKIKDAQDASPKVHRLKNIVAYDTNITDENKQKAEEAGITLYTIEQLVQVGKEQSDAGKASTSDPTADDCYMIMYTSGTTGDPKGVKMTHKMNQQSAMSI